MDHGIEVPQQFDLFKDVRKKKVQGRIVWRFRADLISACKPVFARRLRWPGEACLMAVIYLRVVRPTH